MRELTVAEQRQVAGGDGLGIDIKIDSNGVSTGATLVGLSAAILATGGMAAVPVAVLGAATIGEVVLVGAAMATAAVGGAVMGSSVKVGASATREDKSGGS